MEVIQQPRAQEPPLSPGNAQTAAKAPGPMLPLLGWVVSTGQMSQVCVEGDMRRSGCSDIRCGCGVGGESNTSPGVDSCIRPCHPAIAGACPFCQSIRPHQPLVVVQLLIVLHGLT